MDGERQLLRALCGAKNKEKRRGGKKKRKKEREEQEENGKGRAFTQNRGHTKYGRRQTKQKEFKRKPFLLRAKRR